jgi:rhamnose utilization protein RhaD (predicted bifunctional aldolase and dehydrogenase)
MSLLESEIKSFCTRLGADSLLVQGAGGNISWKEAGVLWVKASGTWIADAETKNIFVAVELLSLQAALTTGNFSAKPKVIGEQPLKPSIETLLHALMPHNIVVHLHPVEAMVHLIQRDAEANFRTLLGSDDSWAFVEYEKPGETLARALSQKLANVGTVQIVLLANHGIVLGGNSVVAIEATLQKLWEKTRSPQVKRPRSSAVQPDAKMPGEYRRLEDSPVEQLAVDDNLFERLDDSWSICPDHVVFLGGMAQKFQSVSAFLTLRKDISVPLDLVFIRGIGIFVTARFGLTEQVQLRFYYEVLSRLTANSTIVTLSEIQVEELIGWDAEAYRLQQKK